MNPIEQTLSEEERAALEDRAEDAVFAGEAAAPADLDAAAPIPVYVAPAVEGYEQRVEAIAQELLEAEQQFKSGDLSFDEFRGTERKLEAQRRELDEARLKHEISVEQSEQFASAQWKAECDRFFRQAAEKEGIDYRAPQNRPLWTALDNEVKALANDPANADRPGGWFLRTAHDNLAARLVGVRGESDAQGGAPVNVAGLERLSGLELEAELARLTPEQAETYLKGR